MVRTVKMVLAFIGTCSTTTLHSLKACITAEIEYRRVQNSLTMADQSRRDRKEDILAHDQI